MLIAVITWSSSVGVVDCEGEGEAITEGPANDEEEADDVGEVEFASGCVTVGVASLGFSCSSRSFLSRSLCSLRFLIQAIPLASSSSCCEFCKRSQRPWAPALVAPLTLPIPP